MRGQKQTPDGWLGRRLHGESHFQHVKPRAIVLGDQQATENEAAEDDQIEKPLKRRRRKKKAEKLPAHLKRKVIEADVAAKDRICPCCSEEMPIVGTDISERLDLIPAELFVWEIRRHKRACCKCKETVAQVRAGEEPCGLTTPVPGSDYGFGVYTQLIVNKFADHLPLYRGEDIFARAGMLIPRNTQFGMLVNIAALLRIRWRFIVVCLRQHGTTWTFGRTWTTACANWQLAARIMNPLLPDVWRKSHPESIRQYRDTEQHARRLTTQQRRTRRREARIA